MAAREVREGALRRRDVVLLAGGLGTRLAPLGLACQKAVAPVDGRPFLARLVDQVRAAGGRRIVLALGHRSADVVRHLAAWRRDGMEIVPRVESHPLGTAGALAWTLPVLSASPVVVMNGDSWAPVDFGRLIDFHRARRARISLAVCPAPDPRRFGRVRFDSDGTVASFEEKPETGGPGWVSAGIYVVERAVIEAIADAGSRSLEHEVFPSYRGAGLHACAFDVPLVDIGTPDSFRAAPDLLARATPAVAP